MEYPYLTWLIIFVFIPSILVWMIWWRYLIGYKKTLFFVTTLAVVWGLVLNLSCSTWLGIWYYQNHLGITWFGLPLEEYLMMIFLPQQVVAWFLLIKKYHGEI
ncbi:MAG: hypothetical protein WC794_03450 [Candidatus Doudnabacteria bacterium]|jgi:hypothetical protein